MATVRSSPSPAKPKRPGDTADRLFRRLVEAVLSGEFAAGQALREAALARSWGVSRTPLREAMRRAAETGLVVLRPNNAPIVCSLSENDVASLYVLRENLELLALELSWPRLTGRRLEELRTLAAAAQPEQAREWAARCLRLDSELHGWWKSECHNPWLQSALDRLMRFLRVLQAWIGQDTRLLAEAHEEHCRILQAIAGRQKNEALRLLREHLRHARDYAVESLTSRQG